ncbi:hypothetical protein LSTR_LSTR010567 [Laodelphax striatellus]|uniref:Secreted protein n=1 Tax=Laodelphax striatellus TaxID=195883 RepID=A0A482XI63_LAOST|nr:hypothetical protein LSTR_LSTR010567 [Laodelphax striatellus]
MIRLPSVGGLLLLPTPVVATAVKHASHQSETPAKSENRHSDSEEEVDVFDSEDMIRLPSVGGLLLLPTPVVATAVKHASHQSETPAKSENRHSDSEEEVDVVSTFDNK